MNDPWQIRVYEQWKLVCTANLIGPAELGRQSAAEEVLYSQNLVAGRLRVVIAHKDDKSVSRQHALLEPLAEGGFRLTNLSVGRPIRLPDGTDLQPQASCSLSADERLTFGSRTVRLQGAVGHSSPLEGLPEAAVPPGQSSPTATPFSRRPQSTTAGIEIKALVRWLQAAMDVHQSAASSTDFFDKAARAVVDLVNLDSGSVLLLKGDEWQTQALHTGARAGRVTDRPASRHVLDRVRQEKRTFWEVPAPGQPTTDSLLEVDAVVAAPILDRQGAVIGALYGQRRKGGSVFGGPITEVEAAFVQLLARGVASGLARLEQEQAALAARVQFEQFFTPELSRQLALQPDLLKGRDTEVTLLFCDIRGFSRISEKLGPAGTVEWVSDVMAALSECVQAHQGVLVDYIGDELMAMWGAPEKQPDHACLACRAALDMLARLPQLNERWQATLGEPMGLGIGINTGVARVGNTGSPYKFKYGPLGNTVNLASRVLGATQYLKSRLLITGATRQAALDGSFATRRLCRVRVVNIAEPVDLHELVLPDQAGWLGAKVEYEKALEAFERQDFRTAARTLGNWRAQQPDDGPALLLLYRAVQCMVEEPAPFDPVWVLPGK